ncbi:MAG: hypothetical protein ACK46E_05670 [Pseudanabaena sp.]
MALPINPVAISARLTVFTRINAIKNMDTKASLAPFHSSAEVAATLREIG